VGGAAIAAGATMYLLGRSAGHAGSGTRVSILPAVAPGGGLLLVQGGLQ
jgi:hypothetical protein